MSGDKNCSKHKEVFEIGKISVKNQVPWRAAKVTYAELARTGQERPKTVENSNWLENLLPERAHPEINATTQIQKVLTPLICTMKIVSKPNINENFKIEEIKRAAEKLFPGIISFEETGSEIEEVLLTTWNESRD